MQANVKGLVRVGELCTTTTAGIKNKSSGDSSTCLLHTLFVVRLMMRE